MSITYYGIIVGLLLTIAWAAGGFSFFLAALILGAIGGLVGAQFEGKIDVRAIFTNRGRG
ncbi:hypothetical protein [Lawsonella clevelandensis]|uniref:DUF2273 domain-containing protein n=1 Tax=Lawsonella clevelandensis TaxID=1528099 RepID=A0A0M4MBS5_9ACTN|nr:hypothetical protein [Lawsonella clevelandensis]ALE18808.1 hypothetical protein AL705_03030 [Lawsonella clevelandensis]ALE34477.1 hypothetical protein IY73_02900 [Lawsonella clevelandensis]MDU7193177.1 DUF2273 domain-containing protein [Lawsonella clevelandensis]VHO00251.1 hypothetical protein LC603019_00592 [Lawsonella clevelandensis]